MRCGRPLVVENRSAAGDTYPCLYRHARRLQPNRKSRRRDDGNLGPGRFSSRANNISAAVSGAPSGNPFLLMMPKAASSTAMARGGPRLALGDLTLLVFDRQGDRGHRVVAHFGLSGPPHPRSNGVVADATRVASCLPRSAIRHSVLIAVSVCSRARRRMSSTIHGRPPGLSLEPRTTFPIMPARRCAATFFYAQSAGHQ